MTLSHGNVSLEQPKAVETGRAILPCHDPLCVGWDVLKLGAIETICGKWKNPVHNGRQVWSSGGWKNCNACLMSKHVGLDLRLLVHFNAFFLMDLKRVLKKGEIRVHDPGDPRGQNETGG